MSFKPLLRRVAERSAPGRSPSYSETQVLMALELVSGEGIGRATLGEKLGIGEGVVRTLIKHLLAEGLVEVSMRGVKTSKKGERLLSDIHGVILKGIEAQATEDVVGGYSYIVLLRGVTSHVHVGVEQRDAALIAGARGATTIIFAVRGALIPGMDRGPSQTLMSFLEEKVKPMDGDVVIVGTGDTSADAQIGAYAAALSLI
jgi:DNA-binding transcriptional regulator LsrR (DeoR family)